MLNIIEINILDAQEDAREEAQQARNFEIMLNPTVKSS